MICMLRPIGFKPRSLEMVGDADEIYLHNSDVLIGSTVLFVRGTGGEKLRGSGEIFQGFSKSAIAISVSISGFQRKSSNSFN